MLYLSGGSICCPGTRRHGPGGVLIDGERIAEIGGEAPIGADILDCSGLVIAPGFIDLASELGDPGETWREGCSLPGSVGRQGNGRSEKGEASKRAQLSWSCRISPSW